MLHLRYKNTDVRHANADFPNFTYIMFAYDSGMGSYALTGRRFGHLTALYPAEDGKWGCRCECGRTVELPADALESGEATTCGCTIRDPPSDKDLSGRWYGMLEVIEPVEPSRFDRYVCRCECGRYVRRTVRQLIDPSMQSCGCLYASLKMKGPNLAGMRHHPLRRQWERFGDGRPLDAEWESYEAFYNWSLYVGWKPGAVLVRERRNEPYGPYNCHWA